jgi:hypothetical protein
VNLIITGREDSSAEVEQLRNRNCAVEVMPSDKLLDRLKENLDFSLFADAIICFMEVDVTELGSPLIYPVGSGSPRSPFEVPGACGVNRTVGRV